MIRKNAKTILGLLAMVLMFSTLSGCNPIAKAVLDRAAGKTETSNESAREDVKEKKEDKEKAFKNKKKKKQKTEKESEDSEISEDIYKEDPKEVFSEMSDWVFIFSSGAGGWSTELRVDPDGSFTGTYSDSEMGSTGKGYDNGTVYLCDFTGRFSKNVRSAGPLMHSLSIESIEFANEPDTEEIKDNILYKYTTPYGIEGLNKVTDYEPLVYMEAGAVTSAINAEEMSWISTTHFGNYLGENWDYVEDVPEELPYAVLINNVDDYAFFGVNRSSANKTNLVNTVKLPGLKNTELAVNRDGTYYCVDENEDGTFRVINTCFKTKKDYDIYFDPKEAVIDSLKKVYGKDAPDPDSLYVTSPKDAFYMQYPSMLVNGYYTALASWDAPGHKNDGVYRDGRFLTLSGYDDDTAFVYAYIIESENRSFPDAAFENCYITSLALTGRDDRISSAGEGTGAVRSMLCDMKLPAKDSVDAREYVMVGSEDKELIKKYHLEDASFNDDYELVPVEKDHRTYKLAQGGYTPFYVQYPEDNFHRLFFSYDMDDYMNRFGDDEDNTCLMTLYLNEDNEVVYGYEVYVP